MDPAITSTHQSVSVVIPCYRSAKTVGFLVERLHEVLPGLIPDYEIVCVVDGSPDDTWRVVQQLAKHPRVRGVHLMRNFGQHNALLAGIALARHEVIVTMDDDLQHPPEEIGVLLEALTDEVDLVYGVAGVEEHGFWRSLASRAVKAALSTTLKVDAARNISAFRAFRGSLRDVFGTVTDAFVSIDVLLSWSTTRVRAVFVTMAQREEGTSNYRFRSLVRHALNMVTGYSVAPLRMVTWLGLLCALLGVALLTYILVLFLIADARAPGFTTIASMVALFSGAQMLALGILGEYIGRLHFRSMQRPAYVIRELAEGGDPGA